MSMWRRGDPTAVMAILAGTALALVGSGPAARLTHGIVRDASVPGAVHGHARRHAAPRRAHAEARTAPAAGRDLSGIAFYASSLGTGHAFEGDYSGRLTWDGSSLEVDLPLAMVRRESVTGAPTYLAGIALALVEDADTPRGWRLVRQGSLSPATDVTRTGADRWMRRVRLRLDGLTEGDLEGRRLVIVQQLDVEDATGSHPAWSYVPAEADLLARLLGGILGGC